MGPRMTWSPTLRDSGELEKNQTKNKETNKHQQKQGFAPLCKISSDLEENVLCRSFGNQKVRILGFCSLLHKLFLSCQSVFIPHVQWREKCDTRKAYTIHYHPCLLSATQPKVHFPFVLRIETSIYLGK